MKKFILKIQDFFHTQSGTIAKRISATISREITGSDNVVETYSKNPVVAVNTTKLSSMCFNSAFSAGVISLFIFSWGLLIFRFFRLFGLLSQTLNNPANATTSADKAIIYPTVLSLFMTLFMMLCVFCICFFALIINQSKE